MFFANLQINNFFNFFLLLFFLNSFLLIDPELIIFFSISFVIILFTSNLSEIALKFFNINFVNYYYNYIKYFNFQLYNVYELLKFLNLNLFIYNFPFYLEYYQNFQHYLNNFFLINFKNWLKLLEYNYFNLIKRIRIRLFKFYFNYYFLITDQIYYLFPRLELNDGTLLLDYFFQNNNFIKPNKKRLINKFKKFEKKFNIRLVNDNTHFRFMRNLMFYCFRPMKHFKLESNDFKLFYKRANHFLKTYNFLPFMQWFDEYITSRKEVKPVQKTTDFIHNTVVNIFNRLVKSFF